MTMTMTDINALRATLAKATAGEWEGYSEPDVNLPYSLFTCDTSGGYSSRNQLEPLHPNDIDAIVALHNAAPALLAEIEALRRDTAGLVEALQKIATELGEYKRKWMEHGHPMDSEFVTVARALGNYASDTLTAHGAA